MVIEWVGVAAAVASAVAAGAALRAAHHSNTVAQELAALEKSRRHAELTPEFRFSFREVNLESRTAKLAIELTGPVAFDDLASVVVTFRTDGMARGEADNVFGPVCFSSGI